MKQDTRGPEATGEDEAAAAARFAAARPSSALREAPPRGRDLRGEPAARPWTGPGNIGDNADPQTRMQELNGAENEPPDMDVFYSNLDYQRQQQQQQQSMGAAHPNLQSRLQGFQENQLDGARPSSASSWFYGPNDHDDNELYYVRADPRQQQQQSPHYYSQQQHSTALGPPPAPRPRPYIYHETQGAVAGASMSENPRPVNTYRASHLHEQISPQAANLLIEPATPEPSTLETWNAAQHYQHQQHQLQLQNPYEPFSAAGGGPPLNMYNAATSSSYGAPSFASSSASSAGAHRHFVSAALGSPHEYNAADAARDDSSNRAIAITAGAVGALGASAAPRQYAPNLANPAPASTKTFPAEHERGLFGATASRSPDPSAPARPGRSLDKEAIEAVEALRKGKRRRRMQSHGPYQQGRWKPGEMATLLTIAKTFIRKELRAVCDICVYSGIKRPSRAIDKQLKRVVGYESWVSRDQAMVLSKIDDLMRAKAYGAVPPDADEAIKRAIKIWDVDGPDDAVANAAQTYSSRRGVDASPLDTGSPSSSSAGMRLPPAPSEASP